MTASPDPVQAQLIAARRKQILEAAVKVFAAKGFHQTTIKDIAREAGVAQGTIYNYFENKTALMLGIFDSLNETDRRAASFAELPSTDIRAFMKAYLRHRLMLLRADNFEVFKVVLSEVMVNKELRELFLRNILEPTFAVAESYLRQWAAQHTAGFVDIGLTMRAVSGMVLGLIVEYLIGDQVLQTRWDELPDFLADFILDGLGVT
jgi:AcrR family transcriptional regulator